MESLSLQPVRKRDVRVSKKFDCPAKLTVVEAFTIAKDALIAASGEGKFGLPCMGIARCVLLGERQDISVKKKFFVRIPRNHNHDTWVSSLRGNFCDRNIQNFSSF